MFIKKLRIFALMMTTSLLLAACSISIPGVVKKEYKMGNIDYNVIDISSKNFNELNKGDFQKWYELNYKNGGVYTFSKDGKRYILIGAGERLTSGYTMKDVVLTGKEEEIEVEAKLDGPQEGETTVQVITYPHILLSISDDGRKLSCSGVELKDNSIKIELKKDSGRFDEITKDGIMKIKISGVPDNVAAKEFMLDDKIKESIKVMNLERGMEIIFTYYLDKDEKPTVLEVNKM
jgi:hypothetical protein